MPDGLGAWPSLSVRETLVVTGRLTGLNRSAAASRADELVERVRLTDLATRPARVLSRGQKQRLGLARALVHEPSVLILDEPASGLDPQARIDLRVLLRSFADHGGTVLISSHILSELDELVDDAVFMRAGEIVDNPGDTVSAAGIWRVRTLEQPDPASHARIAQALGVSMADVGVDRGTWLIACASEAAAAAALAQMVQAGVPIIDYSPTVGRLERAFLALGEQA